MKFIAKLLKLHAYLFHTDFNSNPTFTQELFRKMVHIIISPFFYLFYFYFHIYKQFLAWLSEAESLCENTEADLERNPLGVKVSRVPKNLLFHIYFHFYVIYLTYFQHSEVIITKSFPVIVNPSIS